MIRFFVWTFGYLRGIIPFFSRIAIYTGAIWKFIKMVAGHPSAWFFVALYPVLEFLVEMFTGQRGIVSSTIGWAINGVLNIVTGYFFETNIQAAIDGIPDNVRQVACYMGLTSAMQLLFDGFFAAMIVLINMEIAVMIFWLKAKIVFSKFRLTRLGE